MKLPCAIVGSGNIGMDLIEKLRRSPSLELCAVIGIDRDSLGLQRASEYGIPTSFKGVDSLINDSAKYEFVFEATSAAIHAQHAPIYAAHGLTAIDLTPAKVGPFVVPPVNLTQHAGAPNLNLITCGGQATVPIVYAVSRAAEVPYAEIVSTVASKSAGPGTRQNIDEFTKVTAQALVDIGNAKKGKAIMILNPAEPPILMRNTVYCALSDGANAQEVVASIDAMVEQVSDYVPGYRLKSPPLIERGTFHTPGGEVSRRVVALLEVEGRGDSLPPYAGNLDIMTASAVKVGEALAATAMQV